MVLRVEFVAGVDGAYLADWPGGAGGAGAAAAAVVRLSDHRMVDIACASRIHVGAYRPGQFSSREGPLAVAALRALRRRPDVLICHGHGRAHPERHGLACWVGKVTGLPSVGCCENLLCGAHDPVGPDPGDRADVVHRGEVVGAALRTHRNMNPVYVSVGHEVALDRAVSVILASMDRFRLPLPLRIADVASRAAARLLRGLESGPFRQ